MTREAKGLLKIGAQRRQEAQGEPKVMVFHAISGHGLVFGPFLIRNRHYNSVEYIR